MTELVASQQLALSVQQVASESFGVGIAGTKASGFKVVTLSSTGLAAKAGVTMNDQILAVNGVEVASQDAMFAQFRGFADGVTVTFTVNRKGAGAGGVAAIAPVAAVPAPEVKLVPHPQGKQVEEKYWGETTNMYLCLACCLCGGTTACCLWCYIEKTMCFEGMEGAGPFDKRLKDVMVTEEEAAAILVEAEKAKEAALAAAAAKAAAGPESVAVALVQGTPVSSDLTLVVKYDSAKSFGMSLIGKNVVGNLSADGLAAAAGIQPSDVLLAVDGEEVDGQEKLFAKFNSYANGTPVTFTVAARS